MTWMVVGLLGVLLLLLSGRPRLADYAKVLKQHHIRELNGLSCEYLLPKRPAALAAMGRRRAKALYKYRTVATGFPNLARSTEC